jgi:hypothetical protein
MVENRLIRYDDYKLWGVQRLYCSKSYTLPHLKHNIGTIFSNAYTNGCATGPSSRGIERIGRIICMSD